MHKIGEISLAPGGLFEFEMDSNHLYISHYGTKVEILDDSLIERVDAKTGGK